MAKTIRVPRPFSALAVGAGLGLALLALIDASAAPAAAQAALEEIQLQCRLNNEAWRQCRMRIEQVGEHWWLDVGEQVLEFRHDGRGQITLQRNNGPEQLVEGRWDQASAALCWDGICALGSIPLD